MRLFGDVPQFEICRDTTVLLFSPLEAGLAGAGSAENKSTRPELGWLTADVVYNNKEKRC